MKEVDSMACHSTPERQAGRSFPRTPARTQRESSASTTSSLIPVYTRCLSWGTLRINPDSASMSSTITQTLSLHRESVTSALIEGRSARLQPLQDEILAAISGDPNEQRARREIDRLPERLLFGWMSALRHRGGQSPLDEATLISRCREVIGDDKIWLPQYREASSNDRARLVVVLTWQCETRCTYCSIPKQSGREMSRDVLNSAIELLSSADKPKLELRFFGGEPMMEWAAIQAGIESATNMCGQRDIRFMITTNGFALTPDRCWLGKHPVHVQVALDDLPEAHNKFRRSIIEGQDSYDNSAIDKANLSRSGPGLRRPPYTPRIQNFVDDFRHIADRAFAVFRSTGPTI